MKTTIFNEKTSRCETCKHSCKLISSGNVYGDSFCDRYKNKPISRMGVIVPVAPFAPGWQTEQRKGFAKWYHKERTNGGI